MEIETRVLGPGDWELWRQVRLRSLAEAPEAFGATYAQEESFTEQRWRGWLGDGGPHLVLLEAGDPVAVGAGYLPEDVPGVLHVIAMWTDPGARGRRLAARVLDGLVGWAHPRGLDLVLDVALGNEVARRVYLGYGFTATGATRPIRDGSPDLVEELVLRRG